MTNPVTDAERALAHLSGQRPWHETLKGFSAALKRAEAIGYRKGQEEMRERAWMKAATYRGLAEAIRALPITGADNG